MTLPEPYYDDEAAGITIYNADCRDVLPLLKPGSVDLVLTDPPYGIQYQAGCRADKFNPIVGDESTDVALEGIQISLRSLRDKAHLYLFGRYDLGSLPLQSPVELIWDKGNTTGGNINLLWGKQHEYIQFAVHVPSASHRKRGQGRLQARKRKGSVLRVPRIDGGALRHPTEKPVLLLRTLIESSSCIGDLVLDPFMGVGSTLVAAQIEGRRAIGIEIEERYCDIAVQRLAQQVLPIGATP